jgi:hypothetical protein
VYDPVSGSWSATGSLPQPTAFADAVPVAGGRILVAGGIGTGHQPLASAEVYDPVSGSWSTTGSLPQPTAFAGMAPLPGGGALVAGGTVAGGAAAGGGAAGGGAAGGAAKSAATAAAERWDPATGRFVSVGSLDQPRLMATAVALPGGRVAVLGSGFDAEVFDAATATWTRSDGMATPVEDPAVAVLADGRVLVAGGTSGGSSVASAEVLDPASGQWAGGGSLATAVTGAGAAVLSNGTVLVVGGATQSGGGGGVPTLVSRSDAEVFTPTTTATGVALPAPRAAAGRPTVPAGGGDGPLVGGLTGGAVVLAAVLLAAALGWRRRRLAPAGPPDAGGDDGSPGGPGGGPGHGPAGGA